MEKKLDGYPDIQTVMKGVNQVSQLWGELNTNDQLVKKIIKLTGNSYPEDLYAYVIGGGLAGMSKPLIIPLTKRDEGLLSEEDLTEMLIHETLHNFVGDRDLLPHLSAYWDFVRLKYKAEAIRAQNHIIIYALLQVILSELFGQEKLSEFIKPSSFSPDYKRAWEIVQQEDAQNIIKEFRKYSVK